MMLSGKVCLITGATSGIGLAAAQQLAAQGATVVVVGRNPDSCRRAVESVRAAEVSGEAIGGGTVEWLAADLANAEQVRALAAAFVRDHDRLDVLINNAGAIVPRRTVSPDGVELTLAINHLSPFLLTNLLLDRLVAARPARVVNVSSAAHERGRLDFDDLAMKRGYLPFRAYARSKLANLLFTYELARRLDGTGVTVNAVNPGLVRTGMGRGNGPLRDLAWHLTHLRHRAISLTPAEGADTIVFLAGSPAVETVTGRYFFQRQAVASSPASHDVEAAQRLWSLGEEWTQLTARPPSATTKLHPVASLPLRAHATDTINPPT
jgi:NAD(P)-dependent dehydrogenase (short-subunit alcohol dehydrogenase family)